MSVDIDRIMGCLYVDNMTATEVGEIHRYLQHQEAEIERLREALADLVNAAEEAWGSDRTCVRIALDALSGEK